MPVNHKPIPKEIGDYIAYNPETGEMTWKNPTSNRVKVGSKLTDSGIGYINFCFKGKYYFGHRVAYYLHYGIDPADKFVDHINGDGVDNRIENLRLVTKTGNNQNRNNAVGAYKNHCGNWFSSIKTENTHHYLGTYKTFEEAREAYLKAKRELHAETCSHF